MGFSFFFHGLGSSLITTVGSERPENITFQGKRQKKSAMGRSVPKRWAQVDFTASSFVDTQAERDMIVRKILPKLNFDLQEFFVRVTAVDLRWGVPSHEAEN
jgi:hypothetical protein